MSRPVNRNGEWSVSGWCACAVENPFFLPLGPGPDRTLGAGSVWRILRPPRGVVEFCFCFFCLSAPFPSRFWSFIYFFYFFSSGVFFVRRDTVEFGEIIGGRESVEAEEVGGGNVSKPKEDSISSPGPSVVPDGSLPCRKEPGRFLCDSFFSPFACLTWGRDRPGVGGGCDQ